MGSEIVEEIQEQDLVVIMKDDLPPGKKHIHYIFGDAYIMVRSVKKSFISMEKTMTRKKQQQ